MAYSTFTLRVQDTTPDAVKPTSVTVYVWPLVANTGPRLKRIKDATGKTITGHVKHVASPTEITAGVVDVVLPDPRDTTLSPTAFGWEVRVETNYFKQESVVFGSAELDLYASGGVLLYGKVAPVDAALFTATTSYVVKPTGGTDGQALVKSGTDVVWGTVAGGGGGGAVASVNSKTGAVVLSASDVGADAAGAATAAQSAAISAAATDATTKANAAQAAAVQRATHTGTQTSATISDFTEAAQDALAAALAGASGATVTYNDAANTITITGIGDPETMRDTIGAALVGVGNITVTVNDASDTITISTTATANSTDAALRDRSTHTGTQNLDTTTDSATRLALTVTERARIAASVYSTASANGVDQSGLLQNEQDALAAKGGGVLLLPPGVVVGAVALDAGVVVDGGVKQGCILQRPAAWDGPVIAPRNWSTLVRSGTVGTVHDAGARNLTIDGNRSAGGFTTPLNGAAPATPTTSTSTTGGTLTAGSKLYRIAPLTAAGMGAVSLPVTQVTTGSTSTVTLTWSAVSGATGYVIYGRTFNGTKITEVGAVTSWTDDGSLSPVNSSFFNGANATAPAAFASYGWRPILDNVRIINAPGPGAHVAWGGSTPATGATMEAMFRDVHIELSGTNSLIWVGPHDSMFHNLIAARPGQAGQVTTATTDNVAIENGGPVRFVSSHAWGGARNAWAIWSQTDLTSCQGEGASVAQASVQCPSTHINGLEVFAPAGGSASGVVFGSSSFTVPRVNAYGIHAYGFDSAGPAVDMTHMGAGCTVTGNIDQASGTAIVGTPDTTSYVNLRVNGGAGGGLFQVPGFSLVPPVNVWTPAANKLLSANFQPHMAGSQRGTTSGQPFYVKVPWEKSASIANIAIGLRALGATLTAGSNLLGLYTVSGTTATLIAQSADQSAVWASPGVIGNKVTSLSTTNGGSLTSVSGGAGGYLLIGILAVGTTTPQWYAANAGAPAIPDITVIGMSASDGYTAFQVSGQTGLTALPTSFSFSGVSSQGIVPFVGLS